MKRSDPSAKPAKDLEAIGHHGTESIISVIVMVLKASANATPTGLDTLERNGFLGITCFEVSKGAKLRKLKTGYHFCYFAWPARSNLGQKPHSTNIFSICYDRFPNA